MVSERHAMFASSLLLKEPLEFGLDLPIGQLWSDFDDFYSIGKLLKKQMKNVTLSELQQPVLTTVISISSPKKLSSEFKFFMWLTKIFTTVVLQLALYNSLEFHLSQVQSSLYFFCSFFFHFRLGSSKRRWKQKRGPLPKTKNIQGRARQRTGLVYETH